MKKGIFVLVGLLMIVTTAWAQVPHLLRYQGILQDAQGKPLTGSYTVSFRIYDSEADPMTGALYSETQTVSCDEGLFSVMLGGGGDLSSLPFDKSYWLGLEVEFEGEEVLPRHQISSSAYAQRSKVADHAESATTSQTVVVQGSGSGLDADKVDGLEAAAFLTHAAYTDPNQGNKIRAALDADRLRGAAPGSGNGLDADSVDGLSSLHLITRANHIGTQAPSTISPQGAGSGLDSDTVRGRVIIPGAGNGFDADTVDGYHAVSFRIGCDWDGWLWGGAQPGSFSGTNYRTYFDTGSYEHGSFVNVKCSGGTVVDMMRVEFSGS